MATFVSLLKFTHQGIRDVKDSPTRYEAFKSMAETLGVAVKGVYYTVGHYDIVVITEGTDEAVTAALLKVGSAGNVRSETLRAYSLDEIKKIMESMP